MEEVFIFWLAFSTMVFVAGLAHFVLVRSARDESKQHQNTIPNGWLHDVERRGWSGEEEGVVVNPRPTLPPRVPPKAHVRN